MNRKLNRVLDEIQKTEEKIVQWQNHLKELNIQREQLENDEIVKSIRSMKLGSRELLSVLQDIQCGTIVLSKDREVPDIPDENEELELPETLEGDTAACTGMLDGQTLEKEGLEDESKN